MISWFLAMILKKWFESYTVCQQVWVVANSVLFELNAVLRKSFVFFSNSELGGIFKLFTYPLLSLFQLQLLHPIWTQLFVLFKLGEMQTNRPKCEHEHRWTKGLVLFRTSVCFSVIYKHIHVRASKRVVFLWTVTNDGKWTSTFFVITLLGSKA